MVRQCPKCNVNKPIDEFDRRFCWSCRMKPGTVLDWNGEAAEDDLFVYPVELHNGMPKGTQVRVIKFDPDKRVYVVEPV